MAARVRAVFFLILVASAIAVLSIMATTAAAGHRDIVGDWVILGGGTQVSGDTINVSGNVTVRDGGVLELRNCTLSIDSADDGGRGLLVAATGRLVAYDTVIQGSASRILVTFSNDTLLEGCTVRHIHGDAVQRSGIMCDGGRVSILNSTISDGDVGGVDAYTNLTLANVTATGMPDYALMMVTYFTDRSYTVSVTDCHFYNEGDPSEDSRGIYAWSTIFSPGVDLVVKRTTVEGFGYGLTVYDEDNLDVVVEGCRFVGNKVAAAITQWGGDMAFRGNLFGHCVGDAIRYDAWPAMALVFDGNTVENATRGWVFWAPMVGPGSEVTIPWGHLSVSNCTEAYVAQAYIGTTHFILTNSTLTNCTTAFVAHGDGTDIVTITVFDTPHEKGSGRVDGAGCWIKAYTRVTVSSVRWQDGPPITKGSLILEDKARVEVKRMDLSMLGSRTIPGWYVDTMGKRIYNDLLWPAIYIGGHGFRGDAIDVWAPGAVDVEITDDVWPVVQLDEPLSGHFYATASIAASGTYLELGSGLAIIQRSLDDGPYVNLTSFLDGSWRLPLVGLSEGSHNLTVRGIDLVGNVGNATSVGFHIDTVPPLIDLSGAPDLVNTTSVVLRGRTEPWADLTIAGRNCTVAPDGTFSAEVPLLEGPNDLVLVAKDRAGNSNMTALHVVRDTVPPVLEIYSSEDGIWTNATEVLLEGHTEADADLVVNGERVQTDLGRIELALHLQEGTFRIVVTATDKAGNTALVTRALYVDWGVPRLTITSPEGGSLRTREMEVYITGEVDDSSIDHVTIDGHNVTVISGTFTRLCTLLEGTNVYEVSARDAAGNANSTRVTIVRDLTPPTYTVELLPVDGRLVTIGGELYSTARAVEAHIVSDEEVVVSVHGKDPTSPAKDLRVRFDLKEGPNEVSFAVKDMAENDGPAYAKRVTVDTTPPPIVLYEPQTGQTTREATAVLHGRTDQGCNVTVNGAAVTMLTGGEFRLVVPLGVGKNDITVNATDLMGNANSTVASVIREANPHGGGGPETPFMVGALVGVVVVVIVITAVLVAWRRRGIG